MIQEATAAEIRAFFARKHKQVVTFLGFSGTGYEDPAAMLEHATRVLEEFDPTTTIVNLGGTAEGIGAVYEIAKRKGFVTTGIVSTRARDEGVPLSPYVDVTFYVTDATWGGFVPGGDRLSPTSAAMVENSDVVVAIGGGDVARDELTVAKRMGKRVRFIAADMDHRAARDKASQRGEAVPSDFRGTAGDALKRRT